MTCGRAFLDHRGILLRYLVHLVHSMINVSQGRGLLCGGVRDVGNQFVQACYLLDNTPKRLTRFVNQAYA